MMIQQDQVQGKAVDAFLDKKLDFEKRKRENKLTIEEWLKLPTEGF